MPWSGNMYISMNWLGNLISLCFGRGSCKWSGKGRLGNRLSDKQQSGKRRSVAFANFFDKKVKDIRGPGVFNGAPLMQANADDYMNRTNVLNCIM